MINTQVHVHEYFFVYIQRLCAVFGCYIEVGHLMFVFTDHGQNGWE